MFYVAYTIPSPGRPRPVTFLFNGGPGSSTMWLHMGSFGPMKVDASQPETIPGPPFRYGANPDTLLDITDLVFIDADKENNPGYLEWAVKLTHPGSVIVVDNVIREGAILSPDQDAVLRGTRRVLELMGEHPGLDTAVLQTVGAKHWDGFAIALVK